MRAEGRPSGVAVAMATASGSKAPPARASSYQRRELGERVAVEVALVHGPAA